jgi:hypothetical protein
MKIQRKNPTITHRKMDTWKSKGKEHEGKKEKETVFGTVVRGAGIIGRKIASGVKNLATADNAQKLGDWSRSTGEFMNSRSFGYSGTAPKTKKTKKRKHR